MASKPTSETFSRSSTSSASRIDETTTHSAVHVLRGAVANVLGQRKVTEPGIGKMSVHIDEAPSPQQIARLETAANREVSEDAEFLEFEMERAEADGHFGQQVYDLYANGSYTVVAALGVVMVVFLSVLAGLVRLVSTRVGIKSG